MENNKRYRSDRLYTKRRVGYDRVGRNYLCGNNEDVAAQSLYACYLVQEKVEVVRVSTGENITVDVMIRQLPRVLKLLKNKEDLLRKISDLLLAEGVYNSGTKLEEVARDVANVYLMEIE